MEDRIEGKRQGKMLRNQGEGQTKDCWEEVGGDRRGGKDVDGKKKPCCSPMFPSWVTRSAKVGQFGVKRSVHSREGEGFRSHGGGRLPPASQGPFAG